MAAVSPASAGGGRWEVVRRGRRPAGRPRDPPAAPAAPIATTETLFELGFERAPRRAGREAAAEPQQQQQQQRRQQQSGKGSRKAAGDGGSRPGRFRSLEEALKAFNVADLQKELDKSQSMFPENPSVWVKDLAGCLNYKLQAPKSDPALSQHAHDYPYCLVSKELKNTIRSLLGKSSGVLELFFDHLIYTMLQELDKTPGESLHGYRICIQAVLLERPKIATANLGKYLELLRSHQNRPAKCLTILWALGQAGFTDLAEGLRVWLGVMLPVLGIKALSPYAVSYLDRLLMVHPNLTKGFGMIGPKDFFPLLDFAFMPNNSLSPSLQEQLRRLYPRLKVLALGARPETTLHTYFPSFLSRATPSCPPAMRKELLTSMSQCLSVDPLSFSVWRQLYTKHLSQSSLLLNHLLESWDSGSRKARQALQDTVRSFKVTNEELVAKGPGSQQDVAACDTACKLLLQKMKCRGFPWSRLLLVLLVFTAGFLIHDIQTHGSLQGTLLSSPVPLAAAAVSRYTCAPVALPSVPARPARPQPAFPCRWLERTLPACCSRAAALLQPTLQPLWAKAAELTLHISKQCSTFFSWAGERLCILGSTMGLRGVGGCCLWLRCCHAWNSSLLFGRGEVSWDCVREHLSSFTYSSWIYLQNTTLALKNWALAMISGH
uniref:Transmembrane protein 214 n=1 Tax=Phasianus colchicus TaxID=9054 RepID=A0A669PM15_PHACC